MLSLRAATQDDAQRLFDWRNDPVTRAMAIQTDPVPWDGHVGWLTASLANPRRRLLIGLSDGVPMGTLRFDLSDEILVSITLAPDHRGRGLALPLLTAGIDTLDRPTRLLAQVKPGNTASQRLFERAGFALSGESDGLLNYRRALD